MKIKLNIEVDIDDTQFDLSDNFDRIWFEQLLIHSPNNTIVIYSTILRKTLGTITKVEVPLITKA